MVNMLLGLDGVVLVEIHFAAACACSGFIVVSKSCFGFISPRPLKRWIWRPFLPISMTFARISGMEKSGVHRGLVALAFDQFEDAAGRCREKCSTLRPFRASSPISFCTAVRLVQFDQAGAAADAGFLLPRLLPRRASPSTWGLGSASSRLEEVQVAVLLVEGAHFGLAGKVVTHSVVALADLHQVGRELLRLRVALAEVGRRSRRRGAGWRR